MLGAARAGREWEHARVCTYVPGAGVSVWVRSECRAGRDAGCAQGRVCRAVTRGSTPPGLSAHYGLGVALGANRNTRNPQRAAAGRRQTLAR